MTTTTNVTTATKPITTTHTELTTALLQAISGLSQLISQLAAQLPTTEPVEAKTAAWQEELTAASQPEPVAVCPSPNLSSLWDELSVVELRSLLRSYPIDRSSLLAPIELMRRNELIEALNQIQALGV